MKSLQFKVITGFREDQFYTIDEQEIHKAYYLFMNPEARTIFSNGVALIGKNIHGIEPDYHATMGWNTTHKLETYDFAEMKEKGLLNKFTEIMSLGKQVASIALEKPELLTIDIHEIEIPKSYTHSISKSLADKFRIGLN
jgi:TPP-dependent 2-oxoacid decarboxylase